MSEGESPAAAAFSNEAVALRDLPAHAEVELERVSPRYAAYATLVQFFGLAALAAALWLIPIPERIPIAGASWAPGALAGLAVVASFWAWADARRRALALREHDVIYERGILVRKTVIVPLLRIQHIERASGPLERAFGLERLTCFTAGGLSADLVIRGLEVDRAERVREFVLRRIEGRREGAGGHPGGAEAGSAAAEAPPTPDHEADPDDRPAPEPHPDPGAGGEGEGGGEAHDDGPARG